MSEPGKARWPEALLLGGLIIAVLGVLLGLGLIQQRKPGPSPEKGPVVGPPPQPAAEHARKVLEKFFEGADLEEKLASVRDPQRVRPLMKDYHTKRGHPYPTMGRVSPGEEVVMGSRCWVFFEVEPFSGPRFPVAVEWDGFRFAVDWESMTAYGTIDWAEFVERRPEQAQTLRVYLSVAPDGLKPPGMAADQRAFRVEHRDSDTAIVAVASDATAKALGTLVKGKRVPVTVETAWRNQCEILRLVAANWSE